jgi:glyoxylase-like metal-dependent hydrolase (beta-lactamase superfamily II)
MRHLQNLFRFVGISIFVIIAALLLLIFIPNTVGKPEVTGTKLPALPAESVLVKMHYLKSANAESPEAFSLSGGSLLKTIEIVHGAVLVQHADESFLLDTGLGANVDQQFAQDMPAWLKPVMKYKAGETIASQIDADPALPSPDRIFLSHAHWDHASGIEDFPGVPLWITQSEQEFIEHGTPPSIMPSQFASDINWTRFDLKQESYAGFDESYDIFGDGTAVLVSLSGHSPGSLGLFLNANDGKRRLFVGDAVWRLDSVKKLRGKSFPASLFLDDDKAATNAVIAKLHALLEANPELLIVPSHDLTAWK